MGEIFLISGVILVGEEFIKLPLVRAVRTFSLAAEPKRA